MSPFQAVPLSRGLGTLLSRMKLRRCQQVGDAPMVLGRVWIHGPGEVHLGHRVVLMAPRPGRWSRNLRPE